MFFIFQDTCKINYHFDSSIKFCDEEYSVLYQVKDPHHYQWQTYNSSFSPLSSDQDVYSAFQYTKSSQIDSYPYAGIVNTYMGGGYVFKMNNLGYDQSILKANLDNLKQNGWIDRQTRAVFVEFTIYNPNVNLFSNCLILFEIISTGQIISSSQFSPINLFDINNSSFISFKIIMNVIYMIFISMFMAKEIKEIVRDRSKYFKQFYNYIELIIIAFSWASFSMYLYRLYSSYEVYNLLKKSKKDFTQTAQLSTFIQTAFINLQYISYCNDTLQMFLGFCAAFGTIRFIKLLRFNKKIIVFIQAFSHSIKDLLSFGLLFIILWFSFVQAMYLIFNEKSAQFATLVTSMETLFQLILGKFDVLPIIKANAVFGSIFYILYNILVVCMLINIFLSILTDHYNEARMSHDLDREDPELFSYFKSVVGSVFSKKDKDKAQPTYVDPVGGFPRKMEQFLSRFNKVNNLFFIYKFI